MKNVARAALLGSGVLLTCLVCPALRAANLFVCPSRCTYTKIQQAVDAAASGDVIYVSAGRYNENVKIAGKGLKLLGASSSVGPATEVFAAGAGPVFTLGSGANDPYELIELHHLTIAHGDHEGGSGIGGGVQVRLGSYLRLFDSVVTQNIARFGGGVGVNTPGGPTSTITRCLINSNRAVVDDLQKGSDGRGGAIEVAQGSSVVVQHSSLQGNYALNGGGLYAEVNSRLTLDTATVSGNQAQQVHVHQAFVGGFGGGLAVNSDATISDSAIVDNAATGPEGGMGGGLYLLLGGKDSIVGTIIARNLAIDDSGTGGNGGGILTAAPNRSDALLLDHLYVVENRSGSDAVGGIANEGTLLLRHTVIKDNSGVDCSGGLG